MANESITDLANKEYQYGFTSEVEADQAPRA